MWLVRDDPFAQTRVSPTEPAAPGACAYAAARGRDGSRRRPDRPLVEPPKRGGRRPRPVLTSRTTPPGNHPTSRAENGTSQAVRPAPACLSTRLNEGCPPARSPSGRGHLSLIHISEPTRRTPISYAVFCLKK